MCESAPSSKGFRLGKNFTEFGKDFVRVDNLNSPYLEKGGIAVVNTYVC